MVTAAWSCEKQQRTKLKEMTATCMWRFLYVKNQQKQNYQYLSVFIVSVNIVQFSFLLVCNHNRRIRREIGMCSKIVIPVYHYFRNVSPVPNGKSTADRHLFDICKSDGLQLLNYGIRFFAFIFFRRFSRTYLTGFMLTLTISPLEKS